MHDRPRFALVAGETSGDLLGGRLIEDLRAIHPDAEFAGIGGDRMAAAGLDCWFDASELSVMGLAEVVRHLPRLLRVRRETFRRIQEWKPDCFIGVDAPDFNLGLAKRLRNRGLTTVHYVSPSVWAWRSGRVRSIGRAVDRILTLFPFEPAIYQQHGIDACFVGHPLADSFPDVPDPQHYREELGLTVEKPLVAVLPGSRIGEIERIGPDFAGAMQRLAAQAEFVAPAARPETGARFREMVEAEAPSARVHWLQGASREAMLASDAVLLASGTAALEAMLAKRPMVVGYRIARITYWLVMNLGLMETDRYSLPNTLAGRALVPEILQDQMSPERLATEVERLLTDPAARQQQTAPFAELHASLRAEPGTGARAVSELIERGRT